MAGASVAPVAAIAQATVNEAGADSGTRPVVAVAQQQPSAAEQITQLQRSLEANRKRLTELKASLSDPEDEYAKAEGAFKVLDGNLAELKKQLEKAQKDKDDAVSKSVEGEIDALSKKWTLAKERFDLAIRARKATQETIVSLEEKLKKDGEALDVLLGKNAPQAAPTSAAPAAPSTTPASTPRPAETPAPPGPTAAVTAPAPPAPAQPAGSTPEATVARPVASVIADAVQSPAPRPEAAAPPSQTPEGASPGAAAPAGPPTRKDKELMAATQVAEKTAADAQMAADRVTEVTERMDILKKNIRLERTLRDTARKRLDNAHECLAGLNEDFGKKLSAGQNVDELAAQMREAEGRLHEAESESRRISTHLDELQSELAGLQEEQIVSARDAEHKRLESEEAQRQVELLRNPYTIRNMLQWLVDHGPSAVAIAAAIGICLWLSRMFEKQLLRLMASRGRRGTREERENRAKTVLGVFRGVANMLVVGGGTVMLLDEIGVPIGPLLGGAAVVGLAVAFGAQSLIKDYFTGFMVLLEQQYLINDVIKIGDISGQVERITLRTTVLRDLEGRVHFIPHGQIATVTNFTHGWSRAVFDIGVAYKEDIDRVIEVLVELGKKMRAAPEFRDVILEDLTMLGVESLGDSSVVIKFFIKTRPLKQWTVKREMLRLIKNKFDELGIEIPFPHRTIFHRRESEGEQFGRGWLAEGDDRNAA